MKEETNGTLELPPLADEEKIKHRKGSKSDLPLSKSTLVFVGGILIIGLSVSSYYAVRPVDTEPFTDLEIVWTTNFTDNEEVAPNVTVVDLKRRILHRFKHPNCFGDTNWFKVQDRCFYVFTDNPPSWYVLNGCKLFTGDVVDAPNYNAMGLDSTLFMDFKICCLNYFSENDTEWWETQDENTKSLLSRNLTLDYGLHLNRHSLPPNTSLSVDFNCSIGWDLFDNYWQTNVCSLQASYSQICVKKD